MNRVWFWAVVARWTVLLLSAAADDDVLLYSSFLLTRGGGGGGGGGGGREKVINKKKKDTWCKVIHSTGVFRRSRNAAKVFASLTVCGRAFQSVEAELEKARKPNCF